MDDRHATAGAELHHEPAKAREKQRQEAASSTPSTPPPATTSTVPSAANMQRPYEHHSSSSASPPIGAQPDPEAYRPSLASHGAPASTSHPQPHRLPPMQRFEGPPSHNTQYPQHHPLPPPPPPPHPPNHAPDAYAQPHYAYQNGNVIHPAPMLANGQPGLTRFPIPPPLAPLDARAMSAGRHKKEIKRRTKTGCLTCRKRRIKCDEGLPACRNCAKSKRECLGYDPIFKTPTGPAPIQPAPIDDGTPALYPGAIPVQSPNQYPPPSAYPGTGQTFVHAGDSETPHGYGPPLDPALASGDQSLDMAHANPHPHSERRPNHITIDDLFALNDIPPQYERREAPPPVSAATQQEIADFYNYHYAPGLDRLLETDWYSRSGLEQLRQDARTQDFVAQCIDHFQSRTDDAHSTNVNKSLDARLVWQLATLCRGASSTDHDLIARVDTLENLLTGQYLEPSKVPSPPPLPPQPSSREPPPPNYNAKYNERAFWHHLGRFASVHDPSSSSPSSSSATEHALASMRTVLNSLENRDVLYSIAIVRVLGGSRPDTTAASLPPEDAEALRVARRFVEEEDGRGTTQVVQRVCSMALRGWALLMR